MFAKKFGEHMQYYRKNSGMDQKQLAYALQQQHFSTDEQTISHWETGFKRGKKNQPISMSHGIFVVMCQKFSEVLTPLSAQQWGSYRSFRLTESDLQNIFGDRYDNYEQFIHNDVIEYDPNIIVDTFKQYHATVQQRIGAVQHSYMELRYLVLMFWSKSALQKYTFTNDLTIEQLRHEMPLGYENAMTRYREYRTRKFTEWLLLEMLLYTISFGANQLLLPSLALFFSPIVLVALLIIMEKYSIIIATELNYLGRFK